jgi:hypothetical protein
LAAALNVTAPLLVPDDPAVTDNQSAFEVAVQLQPVPVAVTVTVRLPPPAPMFWLVGAMVNDHGESPSCVTVTGCPATVIVPLRRPVPRFGSTANATDPLPVPDAPEVTVIHAALEAAVHEHMPPVVTVTDPVPPATATF